MAIESQNHSQSQGHPSIRGGGGVGDLFDPIAAPPLAYSLNNNLRGYSVPYSVQQEQHQLQQQQGFDVGLDSYQPYFAGGSANNLTLQQQQQQQQLLIQKRLQQSQL